MSFVICHQTRSLLQETRSLFEVARPLIVDRLVLSLDSDLGWREDPLQVAGELVDSLFRHSEDLIHATEPEGLWQLDLAHRARSIAGPEYLAIGDALTDAVESCIGEAAPGSGMAWSRAYWALLRAMRLHPHLLHP